MPDPRFFLLLTALFLGLIFELNAAGTNSVRISLKSSTSGTAQVYFDTGKGWNRAEQATAKVEAGDSLQPLVFPLPGGVRLKRLRLDPLSKAGIFEIGSTEIVGPDGKVWQKIGADRYKIKKQLKQLSSSAGTITMEAPPGSTDPVLFIPLSKPIDLPPVPFPETKPPQAKKTALPAGSSLSPWLEWVLVAFALAALATAVIPCRWRRDKDKPDCDLEKKGIPGLNSPLLAGVDRIVARFSDPGLIVFDRGSVLVLMSAVAIFAIFSLLGLHGSSTARWDTIVSGEKPHSGLIWGEPKTIRSDEFRVFTPNTFSQVFSSKPFSPENYTIGGGKSPLFWSHPVNHFIEPVRFLLWPFHFLPFESAFSVYWNLKGLVLFTGSYLLFLLFTGSRPFLSASAALWLYFSPITQWWFSHCLPECIGFGCFILVSGVYVVLTRRKLLLWLAAPSLALATLNFALLFYPPFGVPIMWAMLAGGTGYFFQQRRLLFGNDPLRIRWVLLLGAMIVTGGTLAWFFEDTRDTITMILETVYPGRRFYPGGNGTILSLLMGFVDSVFTESWFPKSMRNICEGAGIWLGGFLALPFFFTARRGKDCFNAVDATLISGAVLLIAFLFAGLPRSVAGATLLSMTFGARMKIGIGIIAILLLVRHFARNSGTAKIQWSHWLGAAAVMAVLVLVFQGAFKKEAIALLASTTALLATVNFALLVFAFAGRSVPFFAILLPFLLCHNFLINPVARGFECITGKNLYQQAREIRLQDPDAKWIAFGNPWYGDFLKFMGANVVAGTKFYPVFAYNNILDPGHRYISIWNAYSHVMFTEDAACREAVYEDMPGPYAVRVSATAPALDKLGVKYLLFASSPPSYCQPFVIRHIRDGKKQYWIVRRDLIPKNAP